MSKKSEKKPAIELADPNAPEVFAKLSVGSIIVDPAENCRVNLDPEAIDQLAQSILSDGLQENLVVRIVNTDSGIGHQLVSGYRRHAALVKINRTTTVCKVLDCTAEQARMKNLVENVARKDLTPPELARRLIQLGKAGHSAKTIAEHTGLSTAHVYNMQVLDKLTPELWEEFANPKASQEDPNTLAEGMGEGKNETVLPGKKVNYRLNHWVRIARAKPQDQMALHIQLENAEQAEKAAHVSRGKGSGKPRGEQSDPEGFEPPPAPEKTAWIVTKPQAARVRDWLSEARKELADEDEDSWIAGALAMFRYFSSGEALDPGGNVKPLKAE